MTPLKYWTRSEETASPQWSLMEHPSVRKYLLSMELCLPRFQMPRFTRAGEKSGLMKRFFASSGLKSSLPKRETSPKLRAKGLQQ